MDTYITTTYETNQGPKTLQEFLDQQMSDLRAQASGASTGEDMIQLTDRSYQHQAGFFDTMIARTYVGYGTSTLGLPSISGQVGDADTPSTWILPNSLTGTPGSYLQGSMALPGAMMNHFVLSNWYDPTNGSHCQEIQISGTASTVAGSTKLTDVTCQQTLHSQLVGPPSSRAVRGKSHKMKMELSQMDPQFQPTAAPSHSSPRP